MNQQVTLGEPITQSYANRDAVHLAVFPALAHESLKPGAKVVIVESEARKPQTGEKPHGIIDPFLPRSIKPGQLVWVCMYPKSVQNLRHDWTHPGLIEEPATSDETDHGTCRGC